MNHFIEALISEGKNKALPEEFDGRSTMLTIAIPA